MKAKIVGFYSDGSNAGSPDILFERDLNLDFGEDSEDETTLAELLAAKEALGNVQGAHSSYMLILDPDEESE